MLISHGFVMFHDIFEQNGQRLFFIPSITARSQLAFASAHIFILSFLAFSRAFFFSVSRRVGLPPLFALRFLHSWFPMPNPMTKPPAAFFNCVHDCVTVLFYDHLFFPFTSIFCLN